MNDLTNIQNRFIDYAEKILNSNHLSHSYLIELEDFDKEFPLVLLFIKMILCPHSKYDIKNINCSICNVCKLIDNNCYPDLKIIDVDGNQIKKFQLLELKEEFQNCSLLGKRRVYIIKNADKLNISAANTMLKFLEEPENNIIAFLLTKNRYYVLDTILSRCQILSLIDNSSKLELGDDLLKFISYLVTPEQLFINYKYIIENIMPDKVEAKRIFNDLEEFFVKYISSEEKDTSLFLCLNKCDTNTILKYIMIIEEEIPKLMYNVNYKLWLNSIFSRFVEVI